MSEGKDCPVSQRMARPGGTGHHLRIHRQQPLGTSDTTNKNHPRISSQEETTSRPRRSSRAAIKTTSAKQTVPSASTGTTWRLLSVSQEHHQKPTHQTTCLQTTIVFREESPRLSWRATRPREDRYIGSSFVSAIVGSLPEAATKGGNPPAASKQGVLPPET